MLSSSPRNRRSAACDTSRRHPQFTLFKYALICSILRGSLSGVAIQWLSSEDLMGSLIELLSPTLISDMDTVVAELIKDICSMATAKPVPRLTDGVTLNFYSRGLAWPEESERLHVQWLLLKFHKFASSARQERQPRATPYVRGQFLLDVDHHYIPMVSRYRYR
ncbi:hypothetical protein EDD22DRAFT_575856 [Suillus occidentalis]|nr:hypothetical protein EDD22DRAFT_575856 [Suillus occidentalis]